MKRCEFFLLSLILAAGVVAGEDPGHHCRGAVPFEEASRRPPRLLEGIGTSEFPITTSSPEAQQFFDQGINLLHAFQDFEAYRAFREAARLDPQAAMPQWGMFTALGLNSREMAAERTEALARAKALAATASEREQFWIRAAALLVEPGQGRAAFIREMEALIDRFPDDLDAKLFLANTLSTPPSTYQPDGRPREGKLYGQAILRNLLVTHPDHAAVHHYWIHAVENGPRPGEALESAGKLPRLAPASGHLLHMPGHIYYRLGRYAEAREAFLQSMKADLAYMESAGVSAIAHWNYSHNLDYLIGNCAEDGRYAEGRRWAAELESIRVGSERIQARGAGYVLFGGTTAAARLHMRYGNWGEAVRSVTAALDTLAPEESLSRLYLAGIREFAAGMDALSRSDAESARSNASALDAAAGELASAKPAAGGDWYAGHAARILAVHALELRGALLAEEGRVAEAIAMLRRAVAEERELGYWEPPHYARPVLETLASVQLESGHVDESIETWKQALDRRPNSGHALEGLARAYLERGDAASARETWTRLIDAWSHADPDLPQLVAAKAALTNLAASGHP